MRFTRGPSSPEKLGVATMSAPFFGAQLVGSLGIGAFGDTFDTEAGVLADGELDAQLRHILAALVAPTTAEPD